MEPLIFKLADEAFDAFCEALDKPAQELPKLKANLEKPDPWEK